MGSLDNSPTIQITGTIMVIAIVVLFLVVVFIIFLHLYAKWFWWQMEEPTPPPPPTRRRRRRRPLVFSPGQDIPLRTGLDLQVLRSLPIVIFQSKDYKEGLECAVCLCEVEEGEKARLLPKCNHGFHVDCIDMWFQSHSTCPLCRSKVGPLLPPQNGGSSASDDHNQNEGLEEGNGQPLEDLSSSGHSTESASFPTNVLVWGDQDQVSTTAGGNGCLELGEGTSAQLDSRSSSLSASSSNLDAVLVIDIPEQAGENMAEEESIKSPVAPTRLRSFRRLLSREKRVAPFCSSSSDEV